MSNILDRVDEEIKTQSKLFTDSSGAIPDNIRFRLSAPLIARIVALSRAFRPYRVMQGDTLSKESVSPERGQLFIALMESKLDSFTQEKIASNGSFSNALIGKVNLYKADLRKVDLSEANLLGADLVEAYLREANLRWTNLREIDFRWADLSGADLVEANLRGANLRGAYLRGANLRGAYLIGADLSEANLIEADLRGANLRGAIFTLDKLRRAKILFGCKNLAPEIEQRLREEKRCLFTEKGCE